MDKKEIYREYIDSLNRCVSCFRKLPFHPKFIEDVFTALLLQASLEYYCLSGNVSKVNTNEKKEKKNAR